MSYAVLEEGAVLLRGYACPFEQTLLSDVAAVLSEAPLRQLITPGGQRMSVAMSSCGPLGWYSDRAGYRYTDRDPASGRPWPTLPKSIRKLAEEAAQRATHDAYVEIWHRAVAGRLPAGDAAMWILGVVHRHALATVTAGAA